MAYLEKLKEVLNIKLIKSGYELPRQSGCDKVTIRGNHVLFESDNNAILHQLVLNNLFRDVTGYKEKNDWVVFGESRILVCEMKTDTKDGYEMQLKNGRALVDYIINKIKINDSNLLKRKPKIKYVLFSKSASKLAGGKPRGTFNKDLNGELFELNCGATYLLNDF